MKPSAPQSKVLTKNAAQKPAAKPRAPEPEIWVDTDDEPQCCPGCLTHGPR